VITAGGGPRVALVHDWLTGMRGGEKVLEAIAALYPGAPIHTLFHFPGSVSPALEAHPVVTSFLQRAPGVRRHYRRYLPLFPAAVEDFDLGGFDLVISTSHCVAKGAIPAPGAAHLCYVHTPMRYAWDQEHAYFPARRGAGARLRGMVLSHLRTWDAATAPRVDRFVANSRFVAERIRRYYGREAAVLAPPVDTGFFTPGNGAEGGSGRPYALVVSALAPYKRIDLAVRACREADLDLVVVGDGPGFRALKRLEGPGLDLRGRVEGAELRDLYRGAACLVQPGVEDFGIAPVEALACGTPVVALGRGGVLDIVEEGVHGVLTEPAASDEERVRGLAAAIDKARRIGFNALELRQRAEGFSVDRFQRGFRRLVDDLLAGVPRPGRGVAS
jgi:glycosyltransferase involved in cell wall biosynthesis